MAQVAEASIAQIRVGQVGTIKVDAYSGKTFMGKVTQVATQSLLGGKYSCKPDIRPSPYCVYRVGGSGAFAMPPAG